MQKKESATWMIGHWKLASQRRKKKKNEKLKTE